MSKENFTEGSIERAIYEFWDGYGNDEVDTLENTLQKFSKEDLVAFIVDAQSRDRFGEGYIHP